MADPYKPTGKKVKDYAEYSEEQLEDLSVNLLKRLQEGNGDPKYYSNLVLDSIIEMNRIRGELRQIILICEIANKKGIE